jgi:hypothetical protein
MACGPKEYRARAESCLRRAHTVRLPILAEEFEKLAQSWLRLADAAERDVVVQRQPKKRDDSVPKPHNRNSFFKRSWTIASHAALLSPGTPKATRRMSTVGSPVPPPGFLFRMIP